MEKSKKTTLYRLKLSQIDWYSYIGMHFYYIRFVKANGYLYVYVMKTYFLNIIIALYVHG